MKKIAVVGMYCDPSRPFGSSDGGISYGNRLFYPEILARKKFENEGYTFHTECSLPLEEADIVWCSDLTPELYERIKALPKHVFKVLLACESVIYAPLSHSGTVIMDPVWDVVMTWNHGFEAAHIVHYDLPFAGKTASNLSQELESKQMKFKECGVVIASNKGTDHRGYAPERNFFYKQLAQKGIIDLYGHGWKSSPQNSFKGKIDDKIRTMGKYSYALVIENMWTPGYVTEKLADCILAGIPVIYMGDPVHAQRRFPGTFVVLKEMSEKAFMECKEEIKQKYCCFQASIAEVYKSSDTWCDSFLAGMAECLRRERCLYHSALK